MLEVVIPAYNEAGVITRCLDALLKGPHSEGIAVIVVCNGCVDDTATIARQYCPAATVIETDVASKANALNLGDRSAHSFPRFFVDADIVMSAAAVHQVAAALDSRPDMMAAAPKIEFDLSRCSWAVRAMYRIWAQTPYCGSGMVGSGVYALSAAGRQRFKEFPNITADDAFVRQQFEPRERLTVETCSFTVTPPRTLSGVIAITTRSFYGNYEFALRYPQLAGNRGESNRRVLSSLAAKRENWVGLLIYGGVKLIAKMRALYRIRFRNNSRWDRDESSRQPVLAQPAGAAASTD